MDYDGDILYNLCLKIENSNQERHIILIIHIFLLQANFTSIDYGYNVKFAEIAKKAEIPFCSLLSSSGANARSYIHYLKIKGQVTYINGLNISLVDKLWRRNYRHKFQNLVGNLWARKC